MSKDKWMQRANARMKRKGTVGKFTEYCKGAGYGGVTDQCIEEGLSSRSNVTRKRAQFAKAARSVSKKQGGGVVDKILKMAGTSRAGVEDKIMEKRSELIDAGGVKGALKTGLKEGLKGLKPSMGTAVAALSGLAAKSAEKKAGAAAMADPFRNNEMERKAAGRRGFGAGFKAASDSQVGQMLGKVPVFGKVLQAGAGVVGGLVGGKKAKKAQEKERKDAVKGMRAEQQSQLAQQAAAARQFETAGESGYADVGSSATNSYLAQRGMKRGGVRLPGGSMVPLGHGGAVEFVGKKHTQGGIMLDKSTEVEGGETMDKVDMKKGGRKDYIFSDYLKLGGKTFATRHKEMMKGGASQSKIQELARLQEKKAGRTAKVMQEGGVRKYQTAGVVDEARSEYLDTEEASGVTKESGEIKLDDGSTWSDTNQQAKDKEGFYGGVTRGDFENNMRRNSFWFNRNAKEFGPGGFDPTNSEHVTIFQQQYNDRVPDDKKIEVDGKWGKQSTTATIPNKQEEMTPRDLGENQEVRKELVGEVTPTEKEEEPEEEGGDDNETPPVRTPRVPTLGYMGAGLQLIPPIYALKNPPGYVSGPGAASVVAPNMPRVNYNAERSANANDFRSVSAAIENTGGGPANMVNMIAALSRKQDADREIATAESRANKQLAAEEKRMKLQANETNARLGLQAGQFASQLAREQIKDRREEKLGALDALSERLAGMSRDRMEYAAQERLAEAIGRDGIYDRNQLYEYYRARGYSEEEAIELAANAAAKAEESGAVEKSEAEAQDRDNAAESTTKTSRRDLKKQEKIARETAGETAEEGRRVGKREQKKILADEAAQEAGFEDAKDREQQRKEFEKTKKRVEKRDRKEEGEEESKGGGVSLVPQGGGDPPGVLQSQSSNVLERMASSKGLTGAPIPYVNENGQTVYYIEGEKKRRGGYIRRMKAARKRRR